METKLLGIALLTILTGLYIGMIEIAIGITIAIMLFSYGKNQPKKQPTSNPNETEETVLHPVVYEDAGEPPNLYPEDGSIKVYPDGKKDPVTAQNIIQSTGNIVKGTTKTIINLLR